MSYPPPPTPQKRRPSKWWFVVGGALLVLAVAVFVGGLIWTIMGASKTDGTFDADGQPASVTSPADEKRMLFMPDGTATEPTCTVTDGSGAERDLDDVTGRVTVGNSSGDWRGIASFDSGDGDLTITCTATDPGTEMRVGAPLGFGFAAGLVISIVGPMILGTIGGLILLVTTVLYLTRPRASA
ncbi:hypothetical protein [Nocardioides speluncae]|uniref:hypothetical protein n=1 Tax=Nocardioides speluncae TaxID=2670337 RepID=UPI000D69E0CA|nr:hypothetical protein [Nocardioides speluncae]